LYLEPEDFKIDFSSAIAITGNALQNNRKSVKKMPIVPIKIPMSTNVGWNMVQLEGR
jgi:hypothetical protein